MNNNIYYGIVIFGLGFLLGCVVFKDCYKSFTSKDSIQNSACNLPTNFYHYQETNNLSVVRLTREGALYNICMDYGHNWSEWEYHTNIWLVFQDFSNDTIPYKWERTCQTCRMRELKDSWSKKTPDATKIMRIVAEEVINTQIEKEKMKQNSYDFCVQNGHNWNEWKCPPYYIPWNNTLPELQCHVPNDKPPYMWERTCKSCKDVERKESWSKKNPDAIEERK